MMVSTSSGKTTYNGIFCSIIRLPVAFHSSYTMQQKAEQFG